MGRREVGIGFSFFLVLNDFGAIGNVVINENNLNFSLIIVFIIVGEGVI